MWNFWRKTIAILQDKGYKIEMKKVKNDKKMSLNKLFIYDNKIK